MPCNVDVYTNEMWRHHRSELRSSYSDSEYGHEGMECMLCSGKRMPVML